MAVSPTFIVSLVALATLCGGALEGLPTAGAGTGIARSLPWDVDVAVLETSLDAEAEADDGDDCPHDREWHACGRAHALALSAGGGHVVVARPDPVAAAHGQATRSIRGPPARG